MHSQGFVAWMLAARVDLGHHRLVDGQLDIVLFLWSFAPRDASIVPRSLKNWCGPAP